MTHDRLNTHPTTDLVWIFISYVIHSKVLTIMLVTSTNKLKYGISHLRTNPHNYFSTEFVVNEIKCKLK